MTRQPKTNTALSFYCSNKDDPVHSWRKVLAASTSTTSRWKIMGDLRDARRDKHEDDGFSRRTAPGAEGGESGWRYGLKDIDEGLLGRVHATSILNCDEFGISRRAYEVFGELGGAARVAQSVLVPAESPHLQDCQDTVIQFCGAFITQERIGVFDVERFASIFYNRSLVDDGRMGEADALITYDFDVAVGVLFEGVKLKHVGEKSQNVRREQDEEGVSHLVGEAVPVSNQKAYLEEVHRMGVRFIAKQAGPEGPMIEFLVGQLFEGVLDIRDFFKILFRGKGNGEMTDFPCPTSAPCLVMLILGVVFPHTARGDADLEHRILQKVVALLTCVLALDPRFAQRFADVCGQLPKAVLDATAPEPLTTLRAAVSNPRGADLTVLRRIVAKIPKVAPASRTAPGGGATRAPSARRQGTPRPRTMPIQTTAQLRRGGYLAALVQQPPRVLAPNWPRKARSLLGMIEKEQERKSRLSLEDLRKRLTSYGFTGTPPPWLNRRSPAIFAPSDWPESGRMRSLNKIKEYLEGALAKLRASGETDMFASTAPAPPRRAQPPPPPRRALPPPPQPRAEPRRHHALATEPTSSSGAFPAQSMRSAARVSAPALDLRFDEGCRVQFMNFANGSEGNCHFAIVAATPRDVAARGGVCVELYDGTTVSVDSTQLKACPIFGEGAQVELCGLTGAQSEENDRRGVVVGSNERGLLKVNLVDGRSGFARSVNLRSIPRDQPRRPINTAPTPPSRAQSLPPPQLVLPPPQQLRAQPVAASLSRYCSGANVELGSFHGSSSHLNGRRAAVVKSRDDGEVDIILDDGAPVTVSLDNLIPRPFGFPAPHATTEVSPSRAPTKKSKDEEGNAVTTKLRDMSPRSPEEGSDAIERTEYDAADLLLGAPGGEEERDGSLDDISLDSDNRDAALDEDGAGESSEDDDWDEEETDRAQRMRLREEKKEREKREAATHLCSMLHGVSFERALEAVEAANGDANAAALTLM